jgi:RNA polymerase sigma factor (sigma-70 family)
MGMSRDNFLKDINLWKRIIDKDCGDAFSELFTKYYKPLLNYGLQLVPRKQLVKDSIQELFFTVWDKRSRLSEVENVISYLFTSFSRTLFRQVELFRTWKLRDQIYFTETLSSGLLDTEQLLILEETDKETKENLQKAFNNLSPHKKEVAFLKFYSGFSNDEIGDIMNIKTESVYNYMYRAIAALKQNVTVSVAS